MLENLTYMQITKREKKENTQEKKLGNKFLLTR